MSLALFAAPPDVKSLLELAVILLVFVAPAIRAIFVAKKEEPGSAPPIPSPRRKQSERRAEELSGREVWERLLRGELEVEAPPKPPPPLPPPVPRPARKRAPKKPAPPPLETATPGPLVATEALPSTKTLVDELGPQMSTVSEDEIETRGEDVSAPQPLAAFEKRLEEEDLTMSQITAGTEVGAVPVLVEAHAASQVLGFDLRRAIVLSEVLGQPLALRREPSLPAFR